MSSGNEMLRASRDALKNTGAYNRIARLFDEGTFNEIDAFAKSGDGFAEAAAGFGTIEGCPAYVFAQNPDVCGGAMSKAQASKIKKVYEMAVKTGAPVIGIYDSIGGRLSEGAEMMAAYGEVLLHSNNLSGVVPQIALVLGPCIGVSAMIAANADVLVMSDKGELTLETSGCCSSPEDAVKAGVCHVAAENEDEAIQTVRALITALPSNNLSGAPITDMFGENTGAALTCSSSAADVIAAVADDGSFIELQKGFGDNAVTGLAQVSGATVGLVAYENEIDGDACSKAARFVRMCDAFAIPVVSVVTLLSLLSVREAAKLSKLIPGGNLLQRLLWLPGNA